MVSVVLSFLVFCNQVLQLLHEAHWGISRMKQMARRYVWWPKINSDIESMVQRCSTCQTVAKAPDQKYQPWPKTEKPWERIHLDYAGPFFGKMWFICVDAHSEYPYVVMQNIGQATAKETISTLQQMFAIEGQNRHRQWHPIYFSRISKILYSTSNQAFDFSSISSSVQ